MMGPETYYEILGIGEDADDDAVKQAFRDLAKHFHPDRNPNDADAERQFKRINTAYEGVKDASRRQAYNEWLEFAQKREKVKRTQWGRLAALVFLLLLGPSAVLYWAVVIADIPLFSESTEKPAVANPHRETSLPPPKPERRQPLPPSASAGPEQRTANQSEAAQPPANVPPAVEPAGVPAAKSTPVPPTLSPPPPADPAPLASPAPPAVNGGQGGDKNYTQSLPRQRSFGETLGETDTLSERTTEPGADGPGSSSPQDADENLDAPPRGNGARATARMLARLKEPDGAQSGGVEPGESLPPPSEYAPPPPRDGLPPDTFADCDGCPLISTAGRNEAIGGTGRAAISLTEITLADWDGCVADRACIAYEGPTRGSRRDTIVEVGPREANAYAAWLSGTSGKNYRHVMSPRRREAAAGQRCNNGRRNNSGWEWLDDNSIRNCPPQSPSEAGPDAPRGFRVFRKMDN